MSARAPRRFDFGRGLKPSAMPIAFIQSHCRVCLHEIQFRAIGYGQYVASTHGPDPKGGMVCSGTNARIDGKAAGE